MARNTLGKLHVAGLSVLQGGIGAYIQAGGTTVTGKAHLSIERQVRIAAGSLALFGVLMGGFVHPAFLVIAGFVGAGLVFAGITNWCGMGILLGKMPWNQVQVPEGAAAGGTCAASLPGACAAGPPSGGCAAALPPEKNEGKDPTGR